MTWMPWWPVPRSLCAPTLPASPDPALSTHSAVAEEEQSLKGHFGAQAREEPLRLWGRGWAGASQHPRGSPIWDWLQA